MQKLGLIQPRTSFVQFARSECTDRIIIIITDRPGIAGYNTARNNGAFAYGGINKDGEGRAGYLRYREKLSPVQKYDKPQTSNQMFGWGAETFDYTKGKNNRKPLLKMQFYRTTNAFWPAL